MYIFFVISLLLSLVLGKLIIPVLKTKKVQQKERNLGLNSEEIKSKTPTMGGIIIVCTIIITYILCLIFRVELFYENIAALSIFALITIMFALIGFIDDFLKVLKKDIDGLTPR